MKKQLYIYVPLFLGILLIWSSCKKAPGPVMNEAIAAPDSLQLSVNQQTVSARWEYPAGQPVIHFIVQLARDRGFEKVLASDTLLPDKKSIDFKDIDYLSEYYFRIKAQADNYARSTEYISTDLIFQNILSPVEKSDLTSHSVILKWQGASDGELTDVLIIPDDSAALAPIKLTSSDLKNKMLTVDNLKPLTNYTALIFGDKIRKGVVSFKTKDPNAVITISSHSKEYVSLSDAVSAAGFGDTINIGGTYDFSASGGIEIDKSLVICGIPGVNKPQIKSGTFILKGNVEDFKLYRLKLIGASSYTMDVSGVTGLANVILDSCDISGPTAGLIYASSGASSATYGLTVRHSLIHDFGADGGDFIDFRAGNLTNLQIKNTTFWNLARTFFRIDDNVAYTAGTPALMDHCTVNNACTAPFVSIHAQKVSITVNNSILTNMNSDKGNDFGVSLFGYAHNDNTFGSHGDAYLKYFDYRTHDQTIFNNTHSDPQYADAGNGDFTLGNTTLKAAGIGDPRWLK